MKFASDTIVNVHFKITSKIADLANFCTTLGDQVFKDKLAKLISFRAKTVLQLITNFISR